MTKPSNRTPFAVLAALVAVVLAVTWLHSRRADEDPSMTERAGDRAMAGQGTSKPAPVGVPRQMPMRPSGGSDMFKAEARQRREQRKERSRRAALAFDATERKFVAEPVNPAWAGPQESRLLDASRNQALVESGIAAQSVQATCRSSLCNISARFDNYLDAQTWLQLYMASVGRAVSSARSRVVRNEDGSVTAVIYTVE